MEDLINELRQLRVGRGLRVDKIEQCPALMAVTGATTPEDAHRALLEAVASLDDGLPAESIRTAYALQGRGNELDLRRYHIAEKHDVSPRAIKAAEMEAIVLIAERLAASKPAT